MGRCYNCKWRSPYSDEACNFIEITYSKTTGAKEGQQRAIIIARADDDEGLDAYLEVGPDFGCIHFEQK